MKYGMRERISGGIILVAIAVILVLIFFGRPGHHKEDAAAPDVSFNQQPINGSPANDQPLTLPADASAAPNAVDQAPTDGAVPALDQQNGSAVVNPITPAPAAPQPIQTNLQPAPVVPAAPAQPAVQRPAAPVPAQARPAAPAPSKPAPQPVHKADKPAAAPVAPKAESKPAKLASSDPIMNAAQRPEARPAPAAAPAKPAAPAPSAAVPTDGWSVQAGSFGNNDNAQRLIQRLAQSGFKAYTLKRDPNTVVLVGPFSTSQAAEEARTQMQQRAGTNGLVVRNGKH
ncbi:SPOR domain-containing protein [Zymobacter palmae]|uniref:Uncharacterized protein conserved in bacteria n=1 Tax=Zymobacter palmae TaxID=33074 RepID=A0A348HE50_9GAMM|nr:SPOR domain-containing protein [Zymobacter palmae]BBG29902.1 uncharacterized protein conserved in bacteria [Zymobacter palmae]